MRTPDTRILLAALLGLLHFGGCSEDRPPSVCPAGSPILSTRASTADQVEVSFACQIDPDSAAAPAHFQIGDFTLSPPLHLEVLAGAADGSTVRLTTAPQTALATYTLKVDGLLDLDGNPLSGSSNFVGVGQGEAAQVTFRVDDRYDAQLTAVHLLVSVDPVTGVFLHSPHRLALEDPDQDHIWQAVLSVAVDPARTLDTEDDRLSPRHMAYSARAVDQQDRPLSKLVLFEVPDPAPLSVQIPLLSVPPPPPPEGVVEVLFQVDDRPAKVLQAPTLKGSFDAAGLFDADFPSTITLQDNDGDHRWEGKAKVRIDPARIIGGQTPETQPYAVSLVEGDTPYSARSADFAVPDEKEVEVTILMGHTDLVPVVFRVDTSGALLDPQGASKGVFPGEAVFLTGEFGVAQDAFGQNASDAFSGGENVVLQMTAREDSPGVWEKTLFLPKNRPYGWKVLRCPAGEGCTKINKMVLSSGRAFPTVMKNLVTELCDVSKSTWGDPNCDAPLVLDPRDLAHTDLGGTIQDYSLAEIFSGTGAGLDDQKDPPGTPQAGLMFKQESPDLVVDVKEQAIQTPVYAIGTWRDVNIPGTPADIISGGQILDLSETDYDAGLIGLPPPSYEFVPPVAVVTFKMDGQLDPSATLVAGGGGTMSLHLGISGDTLYLATEDAGEGSDHFILLSDGAPGAPKAAPWGKAGQIAFGGRVLFLADENDDAYAGWFELGATDTELEATGKDLTTDLAVTTPASNGGVLEGTIDLAAIFGGTPAVLYLAVAPWGSGDGGALYPAAQTPPSADGDGDIDADEILKISIPSLQVLP